MVITKYLLRCKGSQNFGITVFEFSSFSGFSKRVRVKYKNVLLCAVYAVIKIYVIYSFLVSKYRNIRSEYICSHHSLVLLNVPPTAVSDWSQVISQVIAYGHWRLLCFTPWWNWQLLSELPIGLQIKDSMWPPSGLFFFCSSLSSLNYMDPHSRHVVL